MTREGRILELLEPPLKSRTILPPAVSTNPLVSVVVPCYNYARYLPISVGSVLAQEGVRLEVIIVDDASLDESRDIAASFAERDTRVRLTENESNRGHIATYNRGLRQARGDYVVLLSADDALAPGALSRSCRLMESEPGIGFTYGPVREFTGDLPRETWTQAGFRSWKGIEWLEHRCRRVTNCIFSPEVVMRRSIFEEVGPYRPELPHTGDLAMWLLAASISDVGFVGGPPAAFYRKHASNMHTSTFRSGEVDGMLTDLEQRKLTFETVFQARDVRDRKGASLRHTALKHLALEALSAAARAYTWGLTAQWPVDDFIDFALKTSPDCRSSYIWRTLAVRRALGTKLSRKNPYFVAEEWVEGWRRNQIREIQVRTGA